MFAYTYVLRCADRDLYIGSTDDIKRRIGQHQSGNVPSTAHRLPVVLIYYEACRSLTAAREREKQLKSGYGRQYLNRRLAYDLDDNPHTCPQC